MTAPTIVYTDGACSGNPGPGGWAWAVPGGAFAAGHAAHTTNQRMELVAAYEAVVAHPGSVEVVTDSTYVMNCFVKRWYVNWLKSGWKNSQKKPVANRDLWEPFVELYLARPGEITFRWVKGHSGDPGNDLVDRLAVEACMAQRPRTGDEPPAEDTLGPADAPGPRGSVSASPASGAAAAPAGGSARDGRVPAGHRLVVLGHRPPELGGYGENPVAAEVRRRLTEILAAKAALHPDLVVLTGLQLGAETLGAEAAAAAGVPYVAVLGFPGSDSRWPAEAKRRFAELEAGAQAVVTLEQQAPNDTAGAAKAFLRRDGWLSSNADEAVLVWNRADRSFADVEKRLLRHLAEEDVWVVAPPT